MNYSRCRTGLLCLLATVLLLLSSPIFADISPRYVAELSGTLRESSGMVTTGKGGFWTINDGTNGPLLHAADTNGNVYRSITLLNAFNYDWEDMTKDDDGNIYIADTGNKNSSYSPSGAYDDLSIYRIPNPDYFCENQVVAGVINFRFPSSSVDNAEGIFYYDDYIYITTKSDAIDNQPYAGRSYLYRVPSTPNPDQQYVAEFVSIIDVSIDAPSKDYYQVTAAALSPDGQLLLLMGERRFWIIRDFTPGVFFDGEMTAYDFDGKLQREAVDFTGNREIYITNEAEVEDGTLTSLDLCPHLDEPYGCTQKTEVARSKVATSYDSGVESTSGQVSTSGNSILLGNEQKTAFRFDELNIPKGAKITKAYIQFRAYSTSNTSNYFTIHAQAVGNAPTFQNTCQNISNRPKTNYSVSGSFGNWTDNDTKNVERSPDISELVQEVVCRPDWDNYNALAFIFEGTGLRTAYSESSCIRSAPELIVEFYEPLELNVGVWLEGAYKAQINGMKTDLNTLRFVLPGQVNTPAGQPYNKTPWDYEGEEGRYYPTGDYASDVVDWVLVSLRSTTQASSTLVRTAMLLHTDGTIHPVKPLPLSKSTTGNFYVVVEHRMHMGAMSSAPVSVVNGVVTHDFRTQNSYRNAASYAQIYLETSVWGLYAADGDQAADANGYDINGADKIPFQIDNGDFYIYSNGDFDMDGDVTGADKSIWLKNNGVFSIVPK